MPKNPPPRKDHNRVPRAPRTLAPAEPREAERVAKVIARAGLGSRREIEEWILAGRVAVNGEILESPARTVTGEDKITVDGAPLPDKERTRLFLYHKPKGVVTTNYDPEGRPTLFEILPGGLPRLVSVGRLDLNTEGLILLTNDGGLSRVLELPETGWLRRYRVRAKGDITQDKLDALIAGVTVDGVHYGPIEAKLDRVQGANSWLTLALREGKNREVRNVLGSLGLDVNRLIRLSYGPFQLGELPQGEVEEVRTRVLADQLGEALAAAAGADFEGPLFNHGEDEAPRRAAKARYAAVEGAEDRHRRRPIDAEPGEGREVTAGIVADRKGRKVLVQRVRSTETEPEEERPARRPRRDDERPRRDGERGGERTFRRRPERSFGTEDGSGHEERAREESSREERSYEERPRQSRPPRAASSRDRKVGGPRPARPRVERDGDAGERPFRGRSERPAYPREEREGGGERPFRGRGDRAERSERPFRERPFNERPRREEGEGDFRPRAERPERPFRERGPRPEGDRAPRRERPEGGRSFRGEGSDRPYSGRVKSEQSRFRSPRSDEGGREERGPRRDRPEDERGFRPRREGEERPFRARPDRAERSERPFGERPRREQADGDFRPRVERAERPFRERGPRPEGERGPRRERPQGDRPQGDRPFRSREDRPREDRPREDRPHEDRAPRGERPEGGRRFDRPEGRSFGQKSFGGDAGERPRRSGGPGKSFGNKSFGDRPGGERPARGGKPGGVKSGGKFGDKPGGRPGGRPGGGKPVGGKPAGGRPTGGKPGGKPGGRPPRPPRG